MKRVIQGGLAVVLVWLAVFTGCRPSSKPEPEPASPAPTTPAGYTVAERGGFVGDEACADCHADLYQSYHRTGMGRSVSRFDPSTAPERFDGNPRVYNAPFDLYYEPFVRGDTLFQREFRLNERGEVIYERIHAADWVVGSGNNTRSYLMQVRGYVTEMPLTWYVERGRWDMSPGYDRSNTRFSRPINLECMTCHNGLPAHSPFTQNHYEEVPLGITCERCHGPGGAHVEARLAGFEPSPGEPDPDIVNPARLDRDRHLAVCQQCHLTGTTVFKPGEDPTTFLPGQPLAAHRSVFAPQEQVEDPEHFGIASHALRLALSACYEQSAMTCTTCHDPHRPTAELDADFFNDACRSCHSDDAHEALCTRPAAATPAEAVTGDCVSCHLQQSGTSDIPHVTFTDHWIRRTLPPSRAAASSATEVARMQNRESPFELVRVDEPAAEGPEAALEEAVAYFKFYETMHPRPAYLPRVVERARAGLQDRRHAGAELALGRALAEMDSLDAAEAVLEAAAEQFSSHAHILYWLGAVRLRALQPEEAVPPLQRAVEIQPAFVEAHLRLALALERSGRPTDAETAYRTALKHDPISHPEAWNDLGFILLNTRRLNAAAQAFRQALNLAPDLVEALINLGTAHMLANDLDGASQLFERAIDVEPSNLAAMGNLGLIYMQQDRRAEARAQFRRILSLDPTNARAREALDQMDESPPSSDTRR